MHKSPQRKQLELAALLTGNTITYTYDSVNRGSVLDKPKLGDRWYNNRYKEYKIFRSYKGNWGKYLGKHNNNKPEWLIVNSVEFFNLET